MKQKKLPLILLLTLSLLYDISISGQTGKGVSIAARIDRVMVYQDRALVTRKGTVNPEQSGIFTVVFRDLPSLIQDGSVRAKVSDSSNIKILDVEVRTYKLAESTDKKTVSLQDKLRKLTDGEQKLEHRIQVLDLEQEYLKEVKNSFLQSRSPQDKGGKAPQRLRIEDYEKMLNYLNEKHLKNRDEKYAVTVRLGDIRKQISVVKGELSKHYEGQSVIQNRKLVKVTVDVKDKKPFVMELSYINYRVNWNPGYDIRVLTESDKTEFTGYGIVSQSSGEDWNDARVSYSTAKPAQRGWIPDLVPLYATVSDKVLQGIMGKNMKQRYGSQSAANRAILGNVKNEEADKKDDLNANDIETTAVKTEDSRAGTLVFHVPKRSNIPSDGSPHRTAISRHDFPVHFEYISIPKLSPYAYLQALGKNTLDTPILQGELNIFMGNDFVGSSYTGNILPGEDFELMLGVNENIRVTRTLEEKHEAKAGFLGNSRKISYTFLIKVENYSGKNITMNVIDQIPVSETDEVKVADVSFSHKPAKLHKKGIVKWQFAMKPQEKIDLTFSFTVVVPKEKEVAFFRTKLPPSLYLQDYSNQRDDYDMESQEKSKDTPALRQKMY